MSREVTIVLNVRKGSSRCPNKLLKDFAGTTLFDIAFEKLESIDNDSVVCFYDKEFCRDSSVRFIERSKQSVEVDGPLSVVFDGLKHLSSDYFMFFNPSCAFVDPATISRALNTFSNGTMSSLTSVIKTTDWLFSGDGAQMTGDVQGGDTKRSPCIYRVAHAFHILPVERIMKDQPIWGGVNDDPYLFEISKIEGFDIDDEHDFLISECLYTTLKDPNPTSS